MIADSVTLRLGGDVTVAKLSDALKGFSKVLDELQVETEANVEWVISGLEFGSAVATASAVALDERSSLLIPRMYESYLEAAHAVSRGVIDQESPILSLVRDLTMIADERNEIILETAVDEVVFKEPATQPRSGQGPTTTKSLGTVRGRVETLSHRRGLRFSLYDLTTDRAVSCYLEPDHESVMRSTWGRIADVTGSVTRHAATGRPTSVRRITGLEVVDEGNSGSYRSARGSVRLKQRSEDIVRNMRDAG